MTKIKYFLLLIVASLVFYNCTGGSGEPEPFDHEAQALIDNDSLVSFLQKHYFDTSIDSIKPLVAGETALLDDVNLHTQNITEDEIDYTLYYYVNNIGTPSPVKDFPTKMDSIFVKYQGIEIATTDSLSVFETKTTPIWFTLNGVIRGWSYGFTNFKSGENVTDNGPITYVNGGQGILFIPSGLAYRNSGTLTIPANSNLLFYIHLWDIVEGTDHDNDGLASSLEDPDGDGDPRNDDTDGDLYPNYVDVDDDGDGTLTKDEDANGDGDPRNDFSGESTTLPDYLNPDVS